MKGHIPVYLLKLVKNLFSSCYTCIKWDGRWSGESKIGFVVARVLCSHRSCLRYILTTLAICKPI